MSHMFNFDRGTENTVEASRNKTENFFSIFIRARLHFFESVNFYT